MSSVLILGATGTIGYAAAVEFQRAGFKVYGITRSVEKANILAQNQIIPVVTTVTNSQSWKPLALKVDVILEALADYTTTDGEQAALRIIKEVVAEKPNKIVIYTSDIWAHVPEKDTDIVTENTPYNPTPFSAYRVAVDKEYLKIGAILVKPTDLYGTKRSIINSIIQQVNSGTGVVNFNGRDRSHTIPIIHATDLGRAFVLVAKRGQEFRGQSFIIHGYNESSYDLAHAIARAAGVEIKFNYIPPTDPFQEALALHIKTTSQKAKILLGWEHLQPSVVDQPELYLQQWRSFHDQEKNDFSKNHA
eukprot:gene3778-4702_t